MKKGSYFVDRIVLKDVPAPFHIKQLTCYIYGDEKEDGRYLTWVYLRIKSLEQIFGLSRSTVHNHFPEKAYINEISGTYGLRPNGALVEFGDMVRNGLAYSPMYGIRDYERLEKAIDRVFPDNAIFCVRPYGDDVDDNIIQPAELGKDKEEEEEEDASDQDAVPESIVRPARRGGQGGQNSRSDDSPVHSAHPSAPSGQYREYGRVASFSLPSSPMQFPVISPVQIGQIADQVAEKLETVIKDNVSHLAHEAHKQQYKLSEEWKQDKKVLEHEYMINWIKENKETFVKSREAKWEAEAKAEMDKKLKAKYKKEKKRQREVMEAELQADLNEYRAKAEVAIAKDILESQEKRPKLVQANNIIDVPSELDMDLCESIALGLQKRNGK